MGGVSVDGGGGGGKKSVDSEVPLVPFIDLLLCCIMFLLVTAVWNQLARINANQRQPGQEAPAEEMPEEKVRLFLQVQAAGYTLASTAGEREEIPKKAGEFDVTSLQTKLRQRKSFEPDRTDIIVAPEDGIVYKDVVVAMDTAVGEGFADVSLSDGAAL